MMDVERFSKFVCMAGANTEGGPSGAELRLMQDSSFILVGNAVEVAKALGREYCECDARSVAVVTIGVREAFEMLARDCDEKTLMRYAYALAWS